MDIFSEIYFLQNVGIKCITFEDFKKIFSKEHLEYGEIFFIFKKNDESIVCFNEKNH